MTRHKIFDKSSLLSERIPSTSKEVKPRKGKNEGFGFFPKEKKVSADGEPETNEDKSRLNIFKRLWSLTSCLLIPITIPVEEYSRI